MEIGCVFIGIDMSGKMVDRENRNIEIGSNGLCSPSTDLQRSRKSRTSGDSNMGNGMDVESFQG